LILFLVYAEAPSGGEGMRVDSDRWNLC
jgi:hypothetical protein